MYGEKESTMPRKQARIPNVVPPSMADDFRKIQGIGPVVDGRLHKAGIHTYAELASLSPVKLAARIPGLSPGQIDGQDWIGQAWKLSSKKTKAKAHKKTTTLSVSRQHYENFTVEFLLDEKKKHDVCVLCISRVGMLTAGLDGKPVSYVTSCYDIPGYTFLRQH